MDNMEERMTHSELVVRASFWLKRICPVVVTECGSASEQPDAIGWKSWSPILIECKASRSDFFSDRKKYFRHRPTLGMGHLRYYMTPKGLIKPEELPENWGLIEAKGKKFRKLVEAKPFFDFNRQAEVGILLSMLQRIGRNAPAGVSIKCYNTETKNRTTLGIESSEALIKTLEG